MGNKKGQALVEYGLIFGLIIIVAVISIVWFSFVSKAYSAVITIENIGPQITQINQQLDCMEKEIKDLKAIIESYDRLLEKHNHDRD